MPRQGQVDVKDGAGAIVASAIAYPGKGASPSARKAGREEGWQKEAWDYYDRVGELRYGANWGANVGSQVTLYAGTRDKWNNIISSDPNSEETQAMRRLFGGVEGQAYLMKQGLLHLTVAGEFYIIMRAPFEGEETEGRAVDEDGTVYEVLGTSEVQYSGDTWRLKREDGRWEPLEERDSLVRVWTPHPKDHTLADSPVRGVLGPLSEICLYDAHVKAQATSRLSGGGVIFLPSEMTLPVPPSLANEFPEGYDPSSADVFVASIMDAMSQAREANGDPSSVAPIAVTVPGEYADKIEHMTFWSELDEKVIEMRDNAILRVARGMDLPPEIFLGTGEMNRWGAWQIEESSIKAHVEPALQVIAMALSVDFLKPVSGNPDAVVGVDTSKLRLRPNRSKEAIELYDRGVLSPETLVRETGFSPDDAADKTERKEWILMQMVQSSWSPEQAVKAAEMLGVSLPGLPGSEDNEPREARPTPSLKEHPTRDRPVKSRSDPDHDPDEDWEKKAAASAVTTLAYRAMERAGNRLKTVSGMKPEGVRSADVHLLITPFEDRIDDLLKDAWGLDSVAHIDRKWTDSMVASADSYCRDLLAHKKPFNHSDLNSILREG